MKHVICSTNANNDLYLKRWKKEMPEIGAERHREREKKIIIISKRPIGVNEIK